MIAVDHHKAAADSELFPKLSPSLMGISCKDSHVFILQPQDRHARFGWCTYDISDLGVCTEAGLVGCWLSFC